ncbi:hypothetical protein [Micromonospora sp. 050-3]
MTTDDPQLLGHRPCWEQRADLFANLHPICSQLQGQVNYAM